LAIAWSICLDREIYPADLIELYPRIANRMALCWHDPVLMGRLLDSLLQDRRGGRKGFPDGVKDELLRLRALFPKEVHVERDPRWGLLAPSDR
jgi:hypothetical protein